MAEIEKSWKSYTCFSADYLKKKKNVSVGDHLNTNLLLILTCQNFESRSAIREVADKTAVARFDSHLPSMVQFLR